SAAARATRRHLPQASARPSNAAGLAGSGNGLDHLPPHDTLAAGSSLLLLNGVGSAIGPALAGVAMTRYGPEALPAFFAATLMLAALVSGGRRLLRPRVNDTPSVFHLMLRTTPTAIELLPEVDPVEPADGGSL